MILESNFLGFDCKITKCMNNFLENGFLLILWLKKGGGLIREGVLFRRILRYLAGKNQARWLFVAERS